MDGLYCKKELLLFLIDNNINYYTKIHSNRIIKDPKTNKEYQVKEFFKEKFEKRKKKKLCSQCIYNDRTVYIIAEKFEKKGDEKIRYLITTKKTSIAQHIRNYKKRWAIEKVIRTCKQYLGITKCQARKKEIHHGYMVNVFKTYNLLELARYKYGLKSVESFINGIKNKSISFIETCLMAIDRYFDGVFMIP